jgi:nucleoid DNA-binding protein
MNKAELGAALAEKLGLPKTQGVSAIEMIAEMITEELKKGQEVTIAGFGSFMSKERKGRTGVNPRTKEKIQIPPIKVPKFKAGKNLKEALKASGNAAMAAAPAPAPTPAA